MLALSNKKQSSDVTVGVVLGICASMLILPQHSSQVEEVVGAAVFCQQDYSLCSLGLD